MKSILLRLNDGEIDIILDLLENRSYLLSSKIEDFKEEKREPKAEDIQEYQLINDIQDKIGLSISSHLLIIVRRKTSRLLLSFSFTQEVCEGTCFSEEEVINMTNNIKELQFDVEKYKEIEVNLNSQIQTYIEQEKLNESLISDYKKQLEFKEEIIDLVRPKWYDNKYLWFFGGIIITSGSVYLAGQIKWVI